MKHRIDEMFPEDLDQYLGEGKDIAILPIGSVEQHGPHLLLGCDSFITLALADITAKISGGVVFPMIPFSWIGGLRTWPGTVDIRSRNMGDYLEETALSILNMGFKRLLLVNCHGGGREMVFSVASRLFKRTGIPVLAMYPSQVERQYPEINKVWVEYGIGTDRHPYEACEMMGGLKYLGKLDILKKVERFVQEAVEEFGEPVVIPEPDSFARARKLGEIGHDYLQETLHVKPRKNVSADAGLAAIKAMAEKLALSLEQLGEYQRHMGIK